ncbi:Alanine--tRNA ligase [Alphaproteobacteria bacterium SO-S41]|nr:Alanine--tRNA ligase [Alphaproteobacteria bacterium SO-S41]
MTSLTDIRSAFLGHFAAQGHEIVPSAPLVPRNDPTLMFVNAGMVPFKNVFTGAETRAIPRATSSQKCVRAGGKHNDLDNVGYTARHHTFFEMLGNFSFGDYFKEQAITLAWDLISKTFALPKDRLLVTVYHTDDVAADLWKKIGGFGDDRIIRIANSDNFWSMGDTGPCGPCSEIFYDYGDKIAGGPPGSPDQDGDRFVEFWNLVFMQYEQVAPGERVDLPKPSIDTGMGLERIASILQGKTSNYDTDLFRALIEASASLTGVAADGPQAASHRVIADHLRASSFLIADGVMPSNEGRGYVLRRIMRRAMRHAHLLGAKDPLMHRLVPVLVAQMGAAYSELVRGEAVIEEMLELEEVRFRQTLERGLRLLDDAVGEMKTKELPGEIAFKLYDTFGFPLDLTQDALRAKDLTVDLKGFDAAMAAQKAAARAAWAGSGEAATEAVWFAIREREGATEFLGYDADTAQGRIVALVKGGVEVDELKAGEDGIIVVNQTPFYGESGGQAGDSGTITDGASRFAVSDTQKKLGVLHVHVGKVESGVFRKGGDAGLTIDVEKRRATRANHSATHLLHEALRRVLGTHVSQKGSLVAHDRLRFDFSHPKALTQAEIAAIEAQVNSVIRDNNAVSTRLMTPDEAVAAGALALFGEKYGDEVRVLGMPSSRDAAGKTFSVELCGGTHVARLGDIALFKIVSESAVSSGVRRIEALTGEAARLYLEGQAGIAREAAAAIKAAPAELVERVVTLADERRRLERELADVKKKLALAGPASSGGEEIEKIGARNAILKVVSGVPAKDLKGLADEAKAKLGSGVVAFVTDDGGKASIVVGVTSDLTATFDAVALVRVANEKLGGKGGGGRPDMAQAGGPDPSKAAEALDAIRGALLSAAA